MGSWLSRSQYPLSGHAELAAYGCLSCDHTAGSRRRHLVRIGIPTYCLRVGEKPMNGRWPKWLPSLLDPSPPRLWRIGYALAVSAAVTMAGLALLWWAALAILNYPRLPHSRSLSLHDTVNRQVEDGPGVVVVHVDRSPGGGLGFNLWTHFVEAVLRVREKDEAENGASILARGECRVGA